MEHEGDNYTTRDWYFGYSNQRTIKGNGWLGGRRTSEDHLNNNIIENGQNIKKSHRDLRRLAVTQTSVKIHQLKLMWETLKEWKNNYHNRLEYSEKYWWPEEICSHSKSSEILPPNTGVKILDNNDNFLNVGDDNNKRNNNKVQRNEKTSNHSYFSKG